jgi:exodeoxyribonuclease VII large subunit
MLGFDAASVSELVNSIKDSLEEQFHEVMVQGEVTNLSPSGAGHWYFTLSDADACISCALFKGDALRNPLIRNLKDGDKIVVAGPLSVYQKRGSFQILAKRILPAGEGQLKLQLERLKNKLASEGLFDLDRKRTLPAFPKRIAVITAPHGAALQDFLNVMRRRTLWADILIIPAVVQGQDSARSLVAAMKKAQEIPEIEVIVLTRGGGSLEDLWSFNDEALVRTIAACPIPVISAVGHQVDFSLCDYVSDFRAETPTAAAENLSQPQTELQARLQYCTSHLRSDLFKLNQRVQIMGQRFHPRQMMGHIWERLQSAQKRLGHIRLTDRAHELLSFHESSQRLDEQVLKLEYSISLRTSRLSDRINRFDHVLRALNPQNVLARGFTYLKTEDELVVSDQKTFEKLSPAQNFTIYFKDGTGKASRS